MADIMMELGTEREAGIGEDVTPVSSWEMLVRETIEALTVLDADALVRLQQRAEAAMKNRQPCTEEERTAVIPAYRFLEKLLEETERNLRRFRMTSPLAEGYGMFSATQEMPVKA